MNALVGSQGVGKPGCLIALNGYFVVRINEAGAEGAVMLLRTSHSVLRDIGVNDC